VTKRIPNYDAKSDESRDIAARSEETDSNCMYGTGLLGGPPAGSRSCSATERPIAGDNLQHEAFNMQVCHYPGRDDRAEREFPRPMARRRGLWY
jgi:hypothetical protein